MGAGDFKSKVGNGREKEKCLREEIEEKIANLTGSKQKIRRDCDKD